MRRPRGRLAIAWRHAMVAGSIRRVGTSATHGRDAVAMARQLLAMAARDCLRHRSAAPSRCPRAKTSDPRVWMVGRSHAAHALSGLVRKRAARCGAHRTARTRDQPRAAIGRWRDATTRIDLVARPPAGGTCFPSGCGATFMASGRRPRRPVHRELRESESVEGDWNDAGATQDRSPRGVLSQAPIEAPTRLAPVLSRTCGGWRLGAPPHRATATTIHPRAECVISAA